MNKTAIKNFAVWARRKLISEITYKAGLLGITEKGVAEPLPQSTKDLQFFDVGTRNYTEVSGNEISQRNALVSHIKEKERTSDYKTAFQSVVEEVAYTWFNRLIAVRFMEVNEYLPSRIRVLSSENPAKLEPDFVTTPFDTDLEFSAYERDRVVQLKDENKLDELFRMLFIKQCNKLNQILPELFQETNDFTELLLTISFTDKDGVVYHLVHDIEEDDFNVSKEGQVEIIGWLYQYYNTEPKDEVFSLLKKNVKITKERIPAATQLFTPDWIVRYMVENSLGRLWVEGHTNDTLKSNWKYYLDEAPQEADVEAQLVKTREEYKTITPEDIKVIDPCIGSGHILVYAFDVLMQIYESYGYTQRDAARSILKNNLYGLDIDKRAYQLTCFALFMKARSYDRRFFEKRENGGRNAPLHVEYFNESNSISSQDIEVIIQLSQNLSSEQLDKPMDNEDVSNLKYLYNIFRDACEYGSIINIENRNYIKLAERLMDLSFSYELKFDTLNVEENLYTLLHLIELAKILSQKYDVVVTNPPYMGSSGMSAKLSDFVKKNYPDSKSDLFAVFIEKCGLMAKKNRYQAMITQHAWMFLSSYEKLRSKMLLNDTVNMAHLGARAFEEIGGEVVQTTAFVMSKSNISNYKATYARLVDHKSQQAKEDAFLAKENLHNAKQDNFSKIPGSPIAYWVSEEFAKAFKKHSVSAYATCRSGIMTGADSIFTKYWFEVSQRDTTFTCTATKYGESKEKWFPINTGGFRKWYGNLEMVVNVQNHGHDIAHAETNHRLRDEQYYFCKGIVWSEICTGVFSARYCSENTLFFVTAPIAIPNSKIPNLYLLALLNCNYSNYVFNIINPTLHYNIGCVESLPVIVNKTEKVVKLTQENVNYSKTDWDSFETSWDFVRHPLLVYGYQNDHGLVDGSNLNKTKPLIYDDDKYIFEKTKGEYKNPNACEINNCFEAWQKHCEKQFNNLKANEEELNRIFIDIYGLQDELTPEVENKDVTVRKADLGRDIRSFISYAVGCMLGRYSIDVNGLVYAGGEWDGSKYETYIPDADNCIPITDEEYFNDDIVGRFVEFVKTVYGNYTLEENLDFIASALGNKGSTPREVIRNYLLKDFYKDHCKIYKKRPIYWLFDSGKEDGFKALIYMHRYNADTIGNLRIEYLHKMQKVYESEISRMQETIDNSTNVREVAAAEKRKEKLIKQLKETKDYDTKIAHLALARIELYLDDGVKVNYEKVQTDADGKKLDVLAKI